MQTIDQELSSAALGLCKSFICNLAFYRAAPTSRKTRYNLFWGVVEANFLALAILEWCKLFGGPKNNHHYWGHIISDKQAFLNELLESKSISEEQLSNMINPIKDYRDKLVGHLDRGYRPEEAPDMTRYFDCVICLHDYLSENECKENGNAFRPETQLLGLPLYDMFLDLGRRAYPSC